MKFSHCEFPWAEFSHDVLSMSCNLQFVCLHDVIGIW